MLVDSGILVVAPNHARHGEDADKVRTIALLYIIVYRQ